MATTTGYTRTQSGRVTADSGIGSVAATATLPVPAGDVLTISVGGTITAISGGIPEQKLILIFVVAATVTNGATIKLAGGVNFVSTTNDTLSLVCDGNIWYETARSVN